MEKLTGAGKSLTAFLNTILYSFKIPVKLIFLVKIIKNSMHVRWQKICFLSVCVCFLRVSRRKLYVA